MPMRNGLRRRAERRGESIRVAMIGRREISCATGGSPSRSEASLADGRKPMAVSRFQFPCRAQETEIGDRLTAIGFRRKRCEPRTFPWSRIMLRLILAAFITSVVSLWSASEASAGNLLRKDRFRVIGSRI